MSTAGVILAGGLSRRMGGGDKCLLPLGGRPLLTHVVERLQGQVDGMVLNTNSNAAQFSAFGLPVVADSIDDYAGPLAGVLAGMDWAYENGFERLISVAADTPFFPEQLVIALKAAVESAGTPLSMAMTPDPERGTNRHPTFGLWDVALREDLRVALQDGVRKVIQWTGEKGCGEVVFDGFDFDPFFNVNTPDDLIKAEQLLQGIK